MPNQQLAKLTGHGQRFWLDSPPRDLLDNEQRVSRTREQAAQFGADQGLEQVVAIVDANGLEQSGPAPYGCDTSALDGRPTFEESMR